MKSKTITARMPTKDEYHLLTPMRPMSEEEIEAAALSDPDNPPLNMRSQKLVPRVKTLRRALRLTQEEFSMRYRIPIGTLRDWEQGRTEPDAPARAYLRVIAAEPEAVRLALVA
jgi:putative transcriptional regulator